MRAVTIAEPGGPEVLGWGEVPDPVCGPGEVIVDVAATAVNRADLLQRQGFYPPPPGASAILGLECSGIVSEVGQDVPGWSVGDEVCALLAGGGYAEQVVVPAGQVMRVPAGVPLVDAAGLPEVACTVWSNLVMAARMREGETLLVHGGAGGIGSFAIQLGKALGVTVLTTAGTEEKRAFCRELGADVAIDYHDQDFVAIAREHGGADVILDNMGAKYLASNVAALASQGRLVIIGMQGGTKAELDISVLLRKRAAVLATTLRARPTAEKAAICTSVVEHVWPLISEGKVRSFVHEEVPLEQVSRAHELMESGSHSGKILLTISE